MSDRWVPAEVDALDVLATANMTDVCIECVEVRYLGIPTGIRPFRLPNGRLTPTDMPVMVLRLTDREGFQGFSLLWFQQQAQAALVGAGLSHLCAEVTPGSNLAELDAGIRAATRFIGEHGVMAFASSGLRMAAEDLVCRRRGVGLAELIGRRRDRVQLYQTGLMLQSSIDELVAEATSMCARGVRAMKMLVGKPDLDEDADRIHAVRDCLPADAVIMVDALQRWDNAETALRAAERFEPFGIKWIEDPLPHGDMAGYRDLAERCPIPIASGETLFAPADVDQLVGAGVPYIVGEPERLGGLWAWLHIAEKVRESGATMLPHLYPHVSAQLLATLRQDDVWLEYVPWFDQLVSQQLSFSADGTIHVDSGPGAGFTPCPDALDRLASGPWRRIDR
ncbi:mandelate racemase/muconate lactonizing enzyme family protein [Mycolicibacterium peregrinum]|uniref:mandelate racemase/muconate lactonizing enzyme family protein n=1 Tax=Mycolicibacterium peregrinum TaxID=43304 RepID=UPI0009ED7602|nr:enolase C-terminal domain-like protein [Mycolicibacterium peregrinum]